MESFCETSFSVDTLKAAGEYQVLAKNKSGIRSFMSEPVNVFSENKQVLEVEDFNYQTRTSNSGYEGKGYVTFNKENDSGFKFQVNVPEAGRWYLLFRYANGSGPVNTDNKCGIRTLFVNNQYASSLVFPQRGSDEWSNWGFTNTIEVELRRGDNQLEIDFEPFNENMNGEINRFLLDQIIFEKRGR